ncbi:MAG: hypothetical protein ACREE0_20595 [Phenylobacterium sp.]
MTDRARPGEVVFDASIGFLIAALPLPTFTVEEARTAFPSVM